MRDPFRILNSGLGRPAGGKLLPVVLYLLLAKLTSERRLHTHHMTDLSHRPNYVNNIVDDTVDTLGGDNQTGIVATPHCQLICSRPNAA